MDKLVHLLASFSSIRKVIAPEVTASVRMTSNFSSFSSGASKRHATESQMIPRNTSRVVGSISHLSEER